MSDPQSLLTLAENDPVQAPDPESGGSLWIGKWGRSTSPLREMVGNTADGNTVEEMLLPNTCSVLETSPTELGGASRIPFTEDENEERKSEVLGDEEL